MLFCICTKNNLLSAKKSFTDLKKNLQYDILHSDVSSRYVQGKLDPQEAELFF